MAGNLSNRSSGVQIPRDICTRLKRYMYTAKCSWIIKPVILTGSYLSVLSSCFCSLRQLGALLFCLDEMLQQSITGYTPASCEASLTIYPFVFLEGQRICDSVSCRPRCFCWVHQVVLMLTSWHLHERGREVCIKAKSPPALIAVIGQVTKHATVKWPIWQYPLYSLQGP